MAKATRKQQAGDAGTKGRRATAFAGDPSGFAGMALARPKYGEPRHTGVIGTSGPPNPARDNPPGLSWRETILYAANRADVEESLSRQVEFDVHELRKLHKAVKEAWRRTMIARRIEELTADGPACGTAAKATKHKFWEVLSEARRGKIGVAEAPTAETAALRQAVLLEANKAAVESALGRCGEEELEWLRGLYVEAKGWRRKMIDIRILDIEAIRMGYPAACGTSLNGPTTWITSSGRSICR